MLVGCVGLHHLPELALSGMYVVSSFDADLSADKAGYAAPYDLCQRPPV